MTNRPADSDNSPDQKIIDYYQSQQISSDRLHAILDDTQSASRNRLIGFALAASLLLMSVVALVHQNILASQQTGMVLREAALNHSSKLQMDAESASLSELQSELKELPFDIVLPESVDFQKLAVVGGRYCTISGNLAAHLKLADPETAQQYSLFLTPNSDNLESLESSEVEVSGVEVKLWQENEVVYAFAATMSDSQ